MGNLVWRGWSFKIMESQAGITEAKTSLRNRVLGRGRAQGGGRNSVSQACAAILSSAILSSKAHVSFGRNLGWEIISCSTTAGNYLGSGNWWISVSLFPVSLLWRVAFSWLIVYPWVSHWVTYPELILSPMDPRSPANGQRYLLIFRGVQSFLPNLYLFVPQW